MAKEYNEDKTSIFERHANKIGGIYQFKELPQLVDVQYPCFAIADLPEIISKLSPAVPEERKVTLQEEFLQIQKAYLNSGFTLLSIDSRILSTQITQKAKSIAQSDLSVGIVNMDRSICTDCHGSQFFHLNISRGEKDGLVSRPGITETPRQQVNSLIEWVKINNFKGVVLVDDVLAYGDTMVPLIKQLQDQLSNISINVLVGIASSQGKWSGIEKVFEKTGVEAQYLSLVKASPENEWSTGMSIPVSRDLTIFGGKVGIDNETGLHTIFPYFLPFSKPKKATLASDINGAERSFKLLKFSQNIVDVIDEYREQELTVADLVNLRVGIPFSNLNSLAGKIKLPELNMSVLDYIDFSRFLLQQNLDAVLEEIKS